MNRDAFFKAVRSAPFNGLTQPQVDGLNVILNEWDKRAATGGNLDIRWLAYMLATTFHETAHTMQPIAEFGGKSRRYAPYYGRGYVQLTWEANYRRASTVVGIDLVKSPDRAMEPAIAVAVMFSGMFEGWFTGQKLADHILGAKCDYVNARRIINGTDRASMIAGYAVSFEKALKADGAVVVALKPGLVVGDSIAVGTGEQLGGFETNAKVGIPSADIIERVKPGYRYYIISAGSNDPDNPKLLDNLKAIRARADGAVIWILPADSSAQSRVAGFAIERGDKAVSFTPGPDHVHPQSYVKLARDVMAVIHTIEAQPQVSDQPVIPDGPMPVMPRPPDDPGPIPPEPSTPPSGGFFSRLWQWIVETLFTER